LQPEPLFQSFQFDSKCVEHFKTEVGWKAMIMCKTEARLIALTSGFVSQRKISPEKFMQQDVPSITIFAETAQDSLV
jgi:hypothetical protein